MGPRYPEGTDCCTTNYATTGSDGRYSFRITKYGLGDQDSLQVYIHAQRPSTGALDSVLAWVRFARVGETAPVTTVDLVLERPY